MVKFQQTLLEDDYKKGAEIYYSLLPYSKFRLIIAAVLVIFGIIVLYNDNKNIYAHFFVFFGIYVLLKKFIYVSRIARTAKRSGIYGKPIEITIKKDGTFLSKAESFEDKINLKQLYGYHVSEIGVLIYIQKNVWVLLKKNSINQYSELLDVIKSCGMKEL